MGETEPKKKKEKRKEITEDFVSAYKNSQS